MTNPVHQWINRWQAAGLLTPATADRLRADVDSAQQEAPEAGDDRVSSPVDRVLSVARGGVLEALGYLGAAVTLGALAVLLDVETWGDAALLGLMVVVAAVAGVGVFLLTPPASAATRRLAGVLGLTSVAATATALVQVFEADCVPACSAWEELGVPFVVSAVTSVVAGILYARHRHLLTHVGLGAAVAATAVTAGLGLAGSGAAGTAQDAWSGGLLFLASVAWVWASESGRLPPAWFGTLAGGGVSFAGLVLATSPWDAWLSGTNDDSVTILAALALASAYTVIGVIWSRLRPTIVGVVGLLVMVPWTFTDVFGWSGRQTAGLLLPVGLVLTIWAIVSGRVGNQREDASSP